MKKGIAIMKPLFEKLPIPLPQNRELARKIVNKYCIWSTGASMIPIPLVDIAALVAIQVKMLREISAVYGTPFAKNRVKSLISALIGTIAPSSMSKSILISAVKAIPFVGGVLGFLTFPAFATASTFAIGEVFISHFESGETLLTFKARKWKGNFKKAFELKKKLETVVEIEAKIADLEKAKQDLQAKRRS